MTQNEIRSQVQNAWRLKPHFCCRKRILAATRNLTSAFAGGLNEMARPTRLERAPIGVRAPRSFQLSYGRAIGEAPQVSDKPLPWRVTSCHADFGALSSFCHSLNAKVFLPRFVNRASRAKLDETDRSAGVGFLGQTHV